MDGYIELYKIIYGITMKYSGLPRPIPQHPEKPNIMFIDPDADMLFRKTSSFLLPVNIALQMPGKFTGVTSAAMSFGLDYDREANAVRQEFDWNRRLEAYARVLV